MQGSLLGNHSLRAIAPPHIFILQNCDRLFNRPQIFPWEDAGKFIGEHSLRAIAPPHLFILQNCDRPLTPFKFSLEKMQGSLLGNHSLRAIAPSHIFILQNCDRTFYHQPRKNYDRSPNHIHKFPLRMGRSRNMQWVYEVIALARSPFHHAQFFPWEESGDCVCEALTMCDRTQWPW